MASWMLAGAVVAALPPQADARRTTTSVSFAPQLRQLVRALVGSRSGEPLCSGRELRLVVAMLEELTQDLTGAGRFTREGFDAGLRDCR